MPCIDISDISQLIDWGIFWKLKSSVFFLKEKYLQFQLQRAPISIEAKSKHQIQLHSCTPVGGLCNTGRVKGEGRYPWYLDASGWKWYFEWSTQAMHPIFFSRENGGKFLRITRTFWPFLVRFPRPNLGDLISLSQWTLKKWQFERLIFPTKYVIPKSLAIGQVSNDTLYLFLTNLVGCKECNCIWSLATWDWKIHHNLWHIPFQILQSQGCILGLWWTVPLWRCFFLAGMVNTCKQLS